MRHDVFNWVEGNDYEKTATEGVFRLRASAPGALYCQAQGFESLVGSGVVFEVETSWPVTYRFDAEGGGKVRTFFYRPQVGLAEADGEVYTNIDRMADESGTVNEVKKALRLFELERRALLAQIRSDAAEAAGVSREAASLVDKTDTGSAAEVVA